jgi:hypothetical protein
VDENREWYDASGATNGGGRSNAYAYKAREAQEKGKKNLQE